MRIVGGTARGRALAAPRSDDVIRPTADRVRETLFNVLGQRCDGLTVLDLFAGTGALGLEAVSRGAARAVLVDRGREALQLCRANTGALGFDDRVELVAAGYEEALARLGRAGRRFDLVFSDPPYKLEAATRVLELLGQHQLVTDGGVAVLESSRAEAVPERVGAFALIDERAFGGTVVRIFRLTSPDA
jgi:16S rRNA (guanine(966)-N(2))-methyltransferase RsmD